MNNTNTNTTCSRDDIIADILEYYKEDISTHTLRKEGDLRCDYIVPHIK